MIFEFSDEQRTFRQVLSRFLADKSDSREVRRLMESERGYDPDVWMQMSQELGLQGIIIPEEYGGMGGTYVDMIAVFEEMGRVLLCSPYFATVALATNVLLHCGDEAAKLDYLPNIACGQTIATAALPLSFRGNNPACRRIQASHLGNGYVLNGFEPMVLDAHVANLILVLANSPAGLSLFGVEAGSEGLSTRFLQTADQTRKLARLELADTPARLIGREGEAESMLGSIFNIVSIYLALEQIGGALHCLEMAVEYAKNRIQFGREIGSFQAIKHMCADLLLDVESAKSAGYFAAWAATEDGDDLPIVASLAKSYCSDTYSMAASANIQIHGGIGYTWETDCHLYFKRAKSSEVLFGTPKYHRSLVAERLGI